jgi:outer membrane lipoprotein SlyB
MIYMKHLALSLIAFLFVSCAAGPNAQTGAVIGGLTGAAVGGIVGNQSGRGLEGAAIGAAAGAVGGGLIGNAQDQRRERDYYESRQGGYYRNGRYYRY